MKTFILCNVSCSHMLDFHLLDEGTTAQDSCIKSYSIRENNTAILFLKK